MSDLVFDVALGPTARLLGVTYLHDVDFDQDGPNIQLAPGGRVQVRDECGVTHGGVVIAVEETGLGRRYRLHLDDRAATTAVVEFPTDPRDSTPDGFLVGAEAVRDGVVLAHGDVVETPDGERLLVSGVHGGSASMPRYYFLYRGVASAGPTT